LEKVTILLVGFRHVCDLHDYIIMYVHAILMFLACCLKGLSALITRLSNLQTKVDGLLSLGIENTHVAYLATLVTNEAMVG
jgi:uncharacterized membrane protein YcgQ (UPF0703/DUF1980 family)